MKKILLPLMMPLLILCTACSDDDDLSTKPKERQDIILSRSESQMVEENVKFAFSLFDKVNEYEEKPNWLIAPFSASVTLGMIANGTEGNTQVELLNALGFTGFSLEEMNTYYKKLGSELKALDNTTQLYLANSIWIDNGLDVYDPFIKTNKDMYDAQVSQLDLDSPNALQSINNWCAQQTENQITRILDKMPEEAKICFLNALYFKGVWKNKFKESSTKEETFHYADGRSNSVKMMMQNEDFGYYHNETFALAEFPYGNSAYSMVVLLPHENKTLTESLQLFTADYWTESVQMANQNLNVQFPRFEMNYETDLIQIMKNLGVSDVFDREKADFSQMTSTSLFLGLLKQATSIKVDEKGTEAASVTVGSGMITAPGPQDPVDFYINRPFAFLIKEKSTGTILFMGKVTEL